MKWTVWRAMRSSKIIRVFLLILLVSIRLDAAVTKTDLTSGASHIVASSATTASITPGANRLVLAKIASNRGASIPVAPTLSGNGLTWVQIATEVVGINQTTRRITLFRAMGASPSSGAVTIDFAGEVQDDCNWSIAEFDSVDTSGTNGSGAIVQLVTSPADNQSSLTVTLAAFGSANNATFGAFSVNTGGDTLTVGTGFTAIHDMDDMWGGLHSKTEWRADNDTTVDMSSSVTPRWAGIAVEIKAAGAAAAPKRLPLLGVGAAMPRFMAIIW